MVGTGRVRWEERNGGSGEEDKGMQRATQGGRKDRRREGGREERENDQTEGGWEGGEGE